MSTMELLENEEDQRLNHSFNLDIYSYNNINFSVSNISKNNFVKNYHFLCKKCNEVPVLKFIQRNIINYICNCKESPKELLIKDIYDHLFYSEKPNIDEPKFECKLHNIKYSFYCDKCKKSLCIKCIKDSSQHKKFFSLPGNKIKKNQYINEKLGINKKSTLEDNIKTEELNKDNNQTIQIKLEENNNIKHENNFESNNNENNKIKGGNYSIIKKTKGSLNLNGEELKNAFEQNIYSEEKNEGYNLLNLLSIIDYDCQEYPNYKHIETISNIEKYIFLYFGDYNEINLKYEFTKENIKNNSLELFGKKFVNNNKNISFLIINKKILKLKRSINLSDIFDNFNEKMKCPFQLEVKLIEPWNKVMKNLSSMFYEITTILPSSDFSKFNTENITDMSYMFYNCSTLKELPDISKFNTKNVKNMSYMFYNCSSITKLPDISKFNTQNVKDMCYIFNNCSSLITLPDISYWNMENIINMNNMFSKCKSLNLIPDISKWKLNKNKLKNINFLFKDCKSLSSLPDIKTKWDINKKFFNDWMIDGCVLLQSNYEKRNKLKLKIYHCFESFLKKIFPYLKIGYITFSIFVISCFLFVAYFPIYTSFNLIEANFSTKNPIEFFGLKNYTDIDYISNYNNLTNYNIINETFESGELFIKNKLDFTSINKDNKFESDIKTYKILSIFFGLLFNFNFILYLIILGNDNFDLIENSHMFFWTIILSLLHIILVVISLVIFRITHRLYNSLTTFYSSIENLFQIEIAQNIWNEVTIIDKSSLFICVILFFSVIFLLSTMAICHNSIEYLSIGKINSDNLINGK